MHEIPHPEWVGWSSEKRECMTGTSWFSSIPLWAKILIIIFIIVLGILAGLFGIKIRSHHHF